jgi:prevent-host-death family protein
MPASDDGSVAADEARDRFGDLLGRAAHGKERVVISRHRKRVAALVPIEDLELLEAFEDARDVAELRKRLANPGGKPIPLDKLAAKLGVKL